MSETKKRRVTFVGWAKDDETPPLMEFEYYPCQCRLIRFPANQSISSLAGSKLNYELKGAVEVGKDTDDGAVMQYFAIVDVIDGARKARLYYDGSGFLWRIPTLDAYIKTTDIAVPGDLMVMKIFSTLLECSDSGKAFQRVQSVRKNRDTKGMKPIRSGSGWTFEKDGNPISMREFVEDDGQFVMLDWMNVDTTANGKMEPFPDPSQKAINELIEWLNIGDFSSAESASKTGYPDDTFIDISDDSAISKAVKQTPQLSR